MIRKMEKWTRKQKKEERKETDFVADDEIDCTFCEFVDVFAKVAVRSDHDLVHRADLEGLELRDDLGSWGVSADVEHTHSDSKPHLDLFLPILLTITHLCHQN